MFMKNKNLVEIAVKKYLGESPKSCKLIGRGANGEVYCVKTDAEPHILAVKVTDFAEMLQKEVNALNYINERADIMLPKVYFSHTADGEIPVNITGMSYLDGIGADKIRWNFTARAKREEFGKAVVENIIKLREVTNEKYGYAGNAVYDNWLDFYLPFAKARLGFLSARSGEGSVTRYVESVLKRAFRNLSVILDDCGKPTLTHGDYWLPNLIVNKRTKKFVGCVDPFDVKYAESEYELFPLMQFPDMGLYDLYKQTVEVSELCDLKSRMYALFSEVYWCELLNHSVEKLYIKEMARLCERELNRADMP